MTERTVEEVVRAVSGFEAKEQIKNKYGSSGYLITIKYFSNIKTTEIVTESSDFGCFLA